MSTLAYPVLAARPHASPGLRERRAEHRRLRRLDQLSARIAELRAIADVLERSAEVVRGGWVQNAWFTVATSAGSRDLASYDVGDAVGRPVSGACLVGSVVQAGGGPLVVRSQLVQRTLDLTWHTLREAPTEPVRWCPGPEVRALHVRDLTRWNDARSRTPDQVVALLRASRRSADSLASACRAEHAALSGGLGSGRLAAR